MKTQKRSLLLLGSVFATAMAVTWALGQTGLENRPTAGAVARMDVSGRLSDVKPVALTPLPSREIPNRVRHVPPGRGPKLGADSSAQLYSSPSTLQAPTPPPILSFDGTSDDDNAAVAGGRVVPPDTNGDVGPNHYVQMNNLVFEIFDKSGNTVLGPLPNNSLWAGFGGICQTNNDGDPIVFHDQVADRWVFSQFAIGSTGHQCFAVSTTSDPTGSYYRYDFEISPGLNGFNDYPKIGMWPDAYYLSANQFGGPGQSFQGPIAVAFDRARMIAGLSATFVKFTLSSSFFSLQPSHWEGSTAPPSGAPNLYAQAWDTAIFGGGGSDGYQLWEFHVDFANPAASTFTSLGRIPTTGFDANLCNFNPCAPQPSPGELLDTLSQFTMYRLTYRNLGGTEIVVGDHNVDVGGNRAGVRWFELRKSGGLWSVYQTGTYAPADGLHRWMASATMDGAGNIAVSYSVSGTSQNPSIRYNTRSPGDPLGELTGGEAVCVAGGGVQTNSFNRWGDYAAISVDPFDDCTFWLTNEYYANSGSFDFKTRVCSFQLPNCGAPANTPPVVTITAPPDGSTFTQGAVINFAGSAIDAEDGDLTANLSWTSSLDGPIGSGGSFSISTLSVGTHTITAAVTDSGGLTGTDSISLTVSGGSTTVAFVSVGAEDGWVLESSENSNQGGRFSATGSGRFALRVGDDNGDRQYVSIVSFDTSSIPDDVAILSATLRLRRSGLAGSNPFLTFSACFVDIRSGGFGGSTALESVDFQAQATASEVAIMSNPAHDGDFSKGELNKDGVLAINKSGTTQFRIYFKLDDNDNQVGDFVGFLSGENSTNLDGAPILFVVYQ